MPRQAKDYNKELWREVFAYSEDSPSKVVWNIDGNNKTKGKPVGWQTALGHWKTELYNKGVQLHRVVYHLFYDDLDVDMVIDHIDGDYSNNDISNLRLVDMKLNGRNRRLQYNSKIGVSGVYERHSFVSSWREDGVQRTKEFPVADYANREEAMEAAIEHRKSMIEYLNSLGYGYTDRHGQ